jgi:AcrR family transcriptional regulator
MPRNAQSELKRTAALDGGDSAAAIRSAVSRQAILDAARELFSIDGYTATSISEIVARAGTSVGLPYYHFGSKKQIFLTLWNEYQVGQEARTRAAVATARKAGAVGMDLLLTGTRAYLHGAWEARDILPMVHSRDTPAGFDAVIREADRRWERQNRALLSEYDPQLVQTAAVLLAGALRAVCLEFPKCKTEGDAEQLIDAALVLFAGLLQGLEGRESRLSALKV